MNKFSEKLEFLSLNFFTRSPPRNRTGYMSGINQESYFPTNFVGNETRANSFIRYYEIVMMELI